MDTSSFRTILITDCGSTTTKARLFEKFDSWRFIAAGESPTTVEEPACDVTIGLTNSFRDLSRKVKKDFLANSGDLKPKVDLFLSTSSAGGGLQVVVFGATQRFSAKSATEASLLSGAIVLKSYCFDEGLERAEVIRELKELRPDIIVVSGGFDGGSLRFPLAICELIAAADPQPRFQTDLKMPVILAVNSAAIPSLMPFLQDKFLVYTCENPRPSSDQEVLEPLVNLIHELFIEHVMSQAPGYPKLLNIVDKPVEPTPLAAGRMVQLWGEKLSTSVLCVDIGGATTDIFTYAPGDIVRRTVSANYGMSYSIPYVLRDAAENRLDIIFSPEEKTALYNKMLRPTTLPVSFSRLRLEHKLAKAALKLSLQHHLQIISKKGKKWQEHETFQPKLVIGSGGVLSHCPFYEYAAEMLIDGFSLKGFVELFTDKVFLLPHLGLLGAYFPEIALEIFQNDCLNSVGILVSPVEALLKRFREELAEVVVNDTYNFSLRKGFRYTVKLPEVIQKIVVKPRFGVFFDSKIFQPQYPKHHILILNGRI